MLNVENTTSQQPTHVANISAEQSKPNSSENSEFNFDDFVDILNPLQHIPIVSQLYQNETKDEISNDAKAVGDVFYGLLSGGILGVLSAVSNAILKNETEKDFSEHLIAMVTEDPESSNTIIDNSPSISNKLNTSLTSVNSSTNPSANPSNKYNSDNLNDDAWSIRMKQIYGDDYS